MPEFPGKYQLHFTRDTLICSDFYMIYFLFIHMYLVHIAFVHVNILLLYLNGTGYHVQLAL